MCSAKIIIMIDSITFQERRKSFVESRSTDPKFFSRAIRRSYSQITFDGDLLKRSSRSSKTTEGKPCDLEIKNDPILDAVIVSDWMAKEYGETSPEYYEAYSKEILRKSIKEEQ